MAFTITPGYTWTNGEAVTYTKLNLAASPTLASNQTYTFAVGSAAAPSINFTGATTTGLYFAATYVGLAVSGSSVGRFTSTGLNNCAVGATTRSTGAFSNIGAGGAYDSQIGINVSGSITGNASMWGILDQSTIQSDVTSQYHSFDSSPSTLAASFSLTAFRHFVAGDVTLGSGSAIGTQVGYYIGALTAGGTNYGLRGLVAAGASNYNLYLDGTAKNYLRGNVGIGAVPTTTSPVHISGLPTSASGLASGDVWNNSGVLTIV